MISLITVNYYSTHLIETLIASLPGNQESDWQLIIVNNSPDDPSIHRLKRDGIFILEAGKNLGFGRGCNLGLQWIYQRNPQALIWLINPDAYLLKNSLQQASNFLNKHPELSVLGTIVYEPGGKIWFGGGQFHPKTGTILEIKNLSSELETADYLEISWVTGCSLLINFKNFTECPQFDEDYFLYYEDFDFCRRYANQGHLIGLTRQFAVIHHPSSITSKHANLKIQHSIKSYLLSLQKHSSFWVLGYRLVRITLTSLISLPFNTKMSLNKLKGLFLYVQSQLFKSNSQRL